MTSPSEKIFKYVPHHLARKYEEMGWEFESPLGLPHSCYAALYKWVGEGEPVEPNIEIEINKKIDKKCDEE